MIRVIIKSFAALLLGLVLLFGAAFAYAQTELGRGQIKTLIEDGISGDGRTAELEELRGFLPFDVRLGRFRLSDDEGVLVEVERLRVDVAPSELIRGHVHVREAGADRVLLERLPSLAAMGPAEPPPAPAPAEPFSLPPMPTLPESLPRVTLDRLHVDRIELGDAILGEAAIFRLEGRGGTGDAGRMPSLSVDLARIDQDTASLRLATGLDLAAETFEIDLKASETGGLLAALSGRADAGDLGASLEGSGPLADWTGALDVDAGGFATLNAEIAFGYARLPRLALDASLETQQGVLPAEIESVIGRQARLAVALEPEDADTLALNALELETVALNVTGQGRAELAEETLDAALSARIGDLADLSGLAGMPLSGSLSLDVHAGGALMGPDVTLALNGRAIEAQGFGIEVLDVELAAKPQGPFGESVPPVRLDGTGRITGLARDGEAIFEGQGLGLDLAGLMSFDGPIVIDRLRLGNQLVELAANADLDASRNGVGRLDLAVDDMAALARGLGPLMPPDLAPRGRLAVGADLLASGDGKRLETTLALTTSDLTGLPAGLDGVLGSQPGLDARLAVTPGEAIEVEALDFRSASISATGNPRIGLSEGQALGGHLEAAIADLARLSDLAGQPLEGLARARVDLAGTASAPDVRLAASIADLVVVDRRFEQIMLEASARGPIDALGGDLGLDVRMLQGQAASLKSAYRITPASVALDGLALRAPATQLDGNATIDRSTALVTASLAGGVADLAALEPFIGQAVQGSVDLDIEASAEGGRQAATAAIDARGISGAFGSLENASLSATIVDALRLEGLDATLEASGFAQADLLVEAVRLEASGSLPGIALDASVKGNQARQAFDLELAADVDAEAPRQVLVLKKLDGRYGPQTLTLESPATAVYENGVLDLDQFDLKLGEARLRTRASYGGGRIDAALDLAALDLATVASLFDLPISSGSATAELTLTGATTAPDAQLRVTMADLGTAAMIDDLSAARAGGLAVDLDAAIEAGRSLRADLDVSFAGEPPLNAALRLPLRVSLEPFTTGLDEATPLDGRIDGMLDLGAVARAAAIDGQRIEGRLESAIDLGGTLGRPQPSGSLVVADGVVEDGLSGFLLQDLAMRIEIDPDRITIAELAGRDRGAGMIRGSGDVALDDLVPREYRVSIDADDLQILDSDFGTARVGGSTRITGDSTGALVTARLTVPRADLRIPDLGPSPPPTLEVLTRRDGLIETPQATTGAAAPFDVTLDVVVDMPARIFVRGRGLDTEWGGSISATGPATGPDVTGEIAYRRGVLDFLGRRFNIDDGLVQFTGASPSMPEITLNASVQASEILARVKAAGTPQDMDITFTSEPPLPRDEVFARILFDRNTSQMTPAQALRLANAVATLEGGGIGALGKVRDALGVDMLDVRGEDEETANVAAGKYISDTVFLEVQRGLQPDSTKARVEIELTPQISASTEVGEDGTNAVGVQWKFDY